MSIQDDPKGELRQLLVRQGSESARQNFLGCLFVIFVVADVQRCNVLGGVTGVKADEGAKKDPQLWSGEGCGGMQPSVDN